MEEKKKNNRKKKFSVGTKQELPCKKQRANEPPTDGEKKRSLVQKCLRRLMKWNEARDK